jgi:hypothetical protein
MTTVDPTLHRIARKVAWWRPAEETLARPDDFLCRVMVWGSWEDAQETLSAFGAERMRGALRHAPAGVFDPRSWHYWHHRLGEWDVPPLPVRALG